MGWRVCCRVMMLVAMVLGAISCSPSSSRQAAEMAPNAAHEHGHEHQDAAAELASVDLADGAKLQAVATTSIVADVAQRVGGDRIKLARLMPLGVDPHAFEPTPQDVAAISDAHVVFINGAGLEVFIEDLLESAAGDATIVPVSHGIELLAFQDADHIEEEDHGAEGHQHEGVDPHTWFDPNNVMIWVDNVEEALSHLDPEHADDYAANAEAYQTQLQDLDRWIRDQVIQVPEANRKLVTDHTAFTYFCAAYGFEQIGAVIPAYSTMAEPSARELVQLQEAIERHEVRAIFVGSTANPRLAERIAEDTGVQVVPLYVGSLTEDGPADDYVSLMRYDVSAIVAALK